MTPNSTFRIPPSVVDKVNARIDSGGLHFISPEEAEGLVRLVTPDLVGQGIIREGQENIGEEVISRILRDRKYNGSFEHGFYLCD